MTCVDSAELYPREADEQYADPVLDMLDPNGVVKHRLFRESCYNHKGNYVKVGLVSCLLYRNG